MAKRIILIIWVALTIFPMVAIGRVSPKFMRLFNSIFGPGWIHVVMHTVLFCGLVLLLLAGFGLRPGWRALGAALLAVLVVAALQEGLQALSQRFFPIRGMLVDLGVDLLGGALGFAIFSLVVNKRLESRTNS